jgi:hypothetical protein
MAATFPATLPQTQLLPGSYGFEDKRAISPFEAGVTQMRPVASGNTMSFSCRLGPLTQTQLQTFRNFYVTTLHNGTGTFNWNDPIDDVTREMRFHPKAPPPQFEVVMMHDDGATFFTTFTIQIMPYVF